MQDDALRDLGPADWCSRTASVDDRATFGENLYCLRQAMGWSQSTLAKAAGLSCAYVSSLENDRRPPPPGNTVRRLATALMLPVPQSQQLQRLAITSRPEPHMELVCPRVNRLIQALKARYSTLSDDVLTAIERELQEAVP